MKLIINMVIAVIAFTTFEPISKLITDVASPQAITAIRFLLGGLMLYPLAFNDIKKKNIELNIKDFTNLALLGFLCICISMLSLQIGVKVGSSPAVVGIIFSVNSVITIFLASIVLKEKITIYKIIAMILCVVGILVMFDFSQTSNVFGIIFALFAAVTFSIFTVLSKKVNMRLSPVITSAISFSVGGLILFIYVLLAREVSPDVLSLKVILVIIYLAIVVTGIGYICFFKAMEYGGAMAASLVFFIKPILTPFVTWIVNGIVPNYTVFIALVLILAGSYFGLKKNK